jgi:hypothetical protein
VIRSEFGDINRNSELPACSRQENSEFKIKNPAIHIHHSAIKFILTHSRNIANLIYLLNRRFSGYHKFMDTITHTLIGAVIAKAIDDKKIGNWGDGGRSLYGILPRL